VAAAICASSVAATFSITMRLPSREASPARRDALHVEPNRAAQTNEEQGSSATNVVRAWSFLDEEIVPVYVKLGVDDSGTRNDTWAVYRAMTGLP